MKNQWLHRNLSEKFKNDKNKIEKILNTLLPLTNPLVFR